MEFKINEEFAKHYNEYRQKEELMKLKSKYGDVKLKKKKPVAGEGDDEAAEDDRDVESDSSSSSDESSESDSEWEDQEQEDFLKLYDALCRNDPALNDDQKVWFKEKPTVEENGNADADAGDDEKNEKKAKEKPVLLKDHVRELLLNEGENGTKNYSRHSKEVDPQAVKQAFLA